MIQRELGIMDNDIVNRTSALEGSYKPGQYGDHKDISVVFNELKNLKLYQVVFWPETLGEIKIKLLRSVGTASIPSPCRSVVRGELALLRIEPTKIWVIGVSAPQLEIVEGATLDLSHSRTHIRISGLNAKRILNSYLPIDLRDSSFPIGSVVSTVFHHVGVTLWRTELGYELFLPRGFALSLWEMLLEGAKQFGYEVITTQ